MRMSHVKLHFELSLRRKSSSPVHKMADVTSLDLFPLYKKVLSDNSQEYNKQLFSINQITTR